MCCLYPEYSVFRTVRCRYSYAETSVISDRARGFLTSHTAQRIFDRTPVLDEWRAAHTDLTQQVFHVLRTENPHDTSSRHFYTS